MDDLNSLSIGLIGAGNMAAALVKGWIDAGLLAPSKLWACDLDAGRLQTLASETGINAAGSGGEIARCCNVVVVATKPPAVVDALQDMRADLKSGVLVVSIAAGVPLSVIQGALPAGTAAIRVMPSTPCLVGAGASAYSRGQSATPEEAALVGKLFNAVGLALEVPESLLDAVTGLSGSGPAYVFIMIEALADGGVRAGLDRPSAMKLAAQTVLGSAQMVLETGEHPGRLKDQVASPAGTTIAGIGVLESRGFRGALMDAVAAAAARSAELSKK
ncbi:MAG: pyrroline-5-carboxylate reductase [Armatimonadota bacterium]|nr:pyrroline-5-carboxylate reductase [Armatimonadota bacterium]